MNDVITPATLSEDNQPEPPHKAVMQAFLESWDPDLPTDNVGKMLTALSIHLGIVIAELTERGVSWEVIDRNVQKHVLRGVDQHMK